MSYDPYSFGMEDASRALQFRLYTELAVLDPRAMVKIVGVTDGPLLVVNLVEHFAKCGFTRRPRSLGGEGFFSFRQRCEHSVGPVADRNVLRDRLYRMWVRRRSISFRQRSTVTWVCG